MFFYFFFFYTTTCKATSSRDETLSRVMSLLMALSSVAAQSAEQRAKGPIDMRSTCIAVVALQLALLTPASAHSPRPALRRPSIEPQASLLAASDKQAGSSQAATSGILTTAFQIINNVAGAGILTLSAGMAAGIGWVPAIAVCIALGFVSGFTFYLLGEACALTGTTTFKELWGATLGEESSWVVDVCIGLMCLACCIIYSGILGDVFTPLLMVAG